MTTANKVPYGDYIKNLKDKGYACLGSGMTPNSRFSFWHIPNEKNGKKVVIYCLNKEVA
tara:strand:+ start:755 stop:931 length:177 start_codon:yes stop_codon:yes gene_type:complete